MAATLTWKEWGASGKDLATSSSLQMLLTPARTGPRVGLSTRLLRKPKLSVLSHMGIMVIYLGKARFVTLSLLLQNCFLITSLLIALSCHNKLQKQVARLIITGFVLVTLRAQQGHGCNLSVAGRLLLQTCLLEKRASQRIRLSLSRRLWVLTFHGPRALLEPESS